MKRTGSKKSKVRMKSWMDILMENIYSLNSSKFFTGLVMLTLNISSKYVTLGLSTSQEEFLKYTLGRQILVFAILWMGTRDIVVALILTCVFIIFADYLFNDNSMFCVIPNNMKDKVGCEREDTTITQKDVNDAIHVLKKAHSLKGKKKLRSDVSDIHIHKGLYKENFI